MRMSDWSSDVCSSDLGGSHIHFQSIGRGGTGTLFSRHIADLLSLRHANAVHDNHVSAAHISTAGQSASMGEGGPRPCQPDQITGESDAVRHCPHRALRRADPVRPAVRTRLAAVLSRSPLSYTPPP